MKSRTNKKQEILDRPTVVFGESMIRYIIGIYDMYHRCVYLYCNERHVNMLDHLDEYFFLINQKCLIDNIILSTARLLDPEKQYKNKQHSPLNWSLEFIKDRVNDPKLTEMIDDKFNTSKEEIKRIKKYKNKVLSHNDISSKEYELLLGDIEYFLLNLSLVIERLEEITAVVWGTPTLDGIGLLDDDAGKKLINRIENMDTNLKSPSGNILIVNYKNIDSLKSHFSGKYISKNTVISLRNLYKYRSYDGNYYIPEGTVVIGYNIKENEYRLMGYVDSKTIYDWSKIAKEAQIKFEHYPGQKSPKTVNLSTLNLKINQYLDDEFVSYMARLYGCNQKELINFLIGLK